jgi:hypothetical protein
MRKCEMEVGGNGAHPDIYWPFLHLKTILNSQRASNNEGQGGPGGPGGREWCDPELEGGQMMGSEQRAPNASESIRKARDLFYNDKRTHKRHWCTNDRW